MQIRQGRIIDYVPYIRSYHPPYLVSSSASHHSKFRLLGIRNDRVTKNIHATKRHGVDQSFLERWSGSSRKAVPGDQLGPTGGFSCRLSPCHFTSAVLGSAYRMSALKLIEFVMYLPDLITNVYSKAEWRESGT
jgi:hypothetical protein